MFVGELVAAFFVLQDDIWQLWFEMNRLNLVAMWGVLREASHLA